MTNKLGLWDRRVVDLPYQDGYAVKAYQNTGERDSIPANHRFAGMRVLTLNERVEWILDDDLTTWHKSIILPDFNLRQSMLANPLRPQYLYFSSSGSDLTGDGTQEKPFRHPQRCVDAIPQFSGGYFEAHALDAGPFDGYIHVPEMSVRDTLTIAFVGAGDSILDVTSMSAGTRDANPTGGTKTGRFRHVAGAHPALTNGSHWLKTTGALGGGEYTFGYVLDAQNSPSPDLSVISSFNLDVTTFGYTKMELVPTTSSLRPSAGSSTMTISATVQANVFVYIIGFSLDAAFVYTRGAVNIDGCICNGAFNPTPDDSYAGQNHNIIVTGKTTCKGSGTSDLYLSGLFLNTVYVGGAFAQMDGIYRNTATPKIQIGFGTLSHPRRASSAILYGDLEGASTVAVYVIGGSLRIYDDGSFFTLDGYSTTAITAWNFSDIFGATGVPSIYGSTTGVPITLDEHSYSVGLTAPGYGSSPYLRNSGTPGNDVLLGTGPSAITVRFSDLPATELNSLTRAG